MQVIEVRDILTDKLQGDKLDGMFVPIDENNRHYRKIQKWIKEGNKPEIPFTKEERKSFLAKLKKEEDFQKLVRNPKFQKAGYVVFENGLIMQWGITGRLYTDRSTRVTFPIKFPNAVLSFQATRQVGVNKDDWANINSLSTSSAVVRAEYTGHGGRGTGYIRWLAIGY